MKLVRTLFTLLVLLGLAGTTLGQNYFGDDPNCVALWPFDVLNAAPLFYDISGNGNNLFGGGSGLNTSDKKEGVASTDMERSGLDNYTVNDEALSSNFPLKSTYASPVKVSFCGWFKPESLPTVDGQPYCLFGKFNTALGQAERCMAFAADFDGANTHMQLLKGYNAGASEEETRHSTALQVGRWYHVGLTYDDTTGAVKIRLWDDTAQTVVEVTDTHAESISLTANTDHLYISARQSLYGQNYLFDGLLDELVFFNDILTSDEIDEIRNGEYGELPTKATNPSPADDATAVHLDSILSWTGDPTVETYDVYLSLDDTIDAGDLVSDDQTDPNYNPPAYLASGHTYYWRVDSTKGYFTATGDVWSFTTTANDFRSDPGCVSVWNFESITGGGPNMVASASSEYSASYPAWKAFDFSTATYWRTTTGGVAPCWLAYSWGPGNERIVTHYDVRAMSTFSTAAPSAWTFDGYDGATWTVLDTQSGQTAWGSGETRTFLIANTTAYQAYRLSISANNGGTTTVLSSFALYSSGGVNLVLDIPANNLSTGTVADDKGSDDLAAVGNGTLPTINSTTYRQGDASIDLENGNWNYLFRPDNKLSSGFPFKAGATNYSFSTTHWIRPETTASYYWSLWSKDMLGISDGHRAYVYDEYLYFHIQLGAINVSEEVRYGIQTGRWFFVASTWDYPSNVQRLYVWDDTLGSVVYNDFSDRIDGDPAAYGGDWLVGGHATGERVYYAFFDGLMDEFTVWNKALSVADIEKIRDGLYSYGATSPKPLKHPIGVGLNVGMNQGL